jgi:amino acid adenylation domain-containing protein
MKENKALYQLALAASQRAKEKGYWLNKLSGEWKKSSFPNDSYKRSTGGYQLEIAEFEFSDDLTSELFRLIRGSDVRLYIAMLAGLNALLYLYMGMNIFTLSDTELKANKKNFAGSDDIVVGTPILKSGKEANLINTILVLRTPVNSGMTFKELVLETRQTVLEAIENQNYPIEILIRQLNISHSSEADFPLFDIVLLLENIHDRKYLNHLNLNMIFSFSRRESSIKGRLEYNPLLYRETTVEQFIDCYKHLLTEAIANTDITLSEIEIISEVKKKQLLVDFNNTSVEYPRDKTIQELFVEQCERTADHIAIVGAQQGVRRTQPLHVPLVMDHAFITYHELNEKSDQLAYLLRKKGVGADFIVGVMLERSIEMIIAVLGILKAGGAYLPIGPNYPEERKIYMLVDSDARVLLKKSEIRISKSEINSHDRNSDDRNKIANCIVLNFEHLDFEFVANFEFHASDFDLSPSSLAYIIYTSGSTGWPKGVLVEQQNVVRLVKNTNYIEFREKERVLQTGALEFDASTFEIWGALLNGLTLYLVPEDDILHPGRLKENIEKLDISTMWLTSPLFNRLCGEDVEMFSGLKNLLVGGDVLSPVHINMVRKRFPELNILNGYGPTENTTFSTTYLITRDYEERIPIGKPIANSAAYIVDCRNRLAPVGMVGELWVGGDGVSRGYLNNPVLTAEKFDQDLWDCQDYHEEKKWDNEKFLGVQGPFFNKVPGRRRLYKTGDLARWQADGNIEFIGRIDHQVKIRGFRIEPGEIESRLLNHIQVKEAVVLVREDSSGDKYLCAYIVAVTPPQQPFNVSELRENLLRDLPDYMVPAYIVTLDKMPLTPNGKVDRAALPIPEVYATVQYAYTAPRNRLEQKLVELWSEVLKVNREYLGIDANFIEMGGHSLKATLLVSKIHKTFAVDVPLAEIYTRPTIRELAGYIRAAKQDKYLSIEPGELKDYYPLSSAQKRLYILQQLDMESTAYNIPEFMVLAGNLNIDRMECTFKELIARHESLRTFFEMIRDDPVQRIHVGVEFEIEYYSPTEDKEKTEERKQKTKEILQDKKLLTAPLSSRRATPSQLPTDFVQPFDLSQAPLFRVGLIKEEDMKHILMVDMHHIISDGTSIGVLIREFMILYEREVLPPVKIQYKDFSEWQNSEREREAIKQQERYWLKDFAGEMPVLNLPLDYARPVIQDFAGNTVTFQIGQEQTQKLKVLAVKEDASLYMVLLTLYSILLSKLSGQENIIVGCPVAGRMHGDLENIIGMFVNTLALKNYPTGEKRVIEFLKEIREKTLAAFENQDYQFEDLVEKVVVNRDTSRNPLFDVVLVMQNLDITEIQIPGLKLSPFAYENKISKFDMTWTSTESEKGIFFAVNYCTKLFKMETMNRFTKYFKKIIVSILENPEVTIQDIEIITDDEKEQVLYRFNETRTAYPNDKTIHELFEEQAVRMPDGIAVIGGGWHPQLIKGRKAERAEQRVGAWGAVPLPRERVSITYGELNQKSNQLATVLGEKGVGSDTIVGIMVERSVEMIIGILGILKAGGAYLPIDPAYPLDRINYMLKDSKARILLSEVSELNGVAEVIEFPSLIIEKENTEPTHLTYPTHLCYIIYTSGTTGLPKGTMIDHCSLVNQCTWHSRYYHITESDHSSQYAGIGFDAAVFEIFPYLTKGATLHIISDAIKLDLSALKGYFNKSSITVTFLPTQFCQQFMEEETETPSLRTVITGGEKLNRFFKRSYRLYNNYGPTENTVVATACLVEREYGNIPIGKPVQNNRIYILDKHSCQLQPIGVPGELCITGTSLSRGYLNRPELTAEKFISTSYKSYRTNISKKIYKTGDLARWLPDGNIEFLGRLDHQVKVRGFRIELGEIENMLLGHKAIKEAVVVDVDLDKKAGAGDGSSDKSLCAFIVVNREFESITNTGDFREHLSCILPDYMIPSFFVQLENLPLTPNGKLNRKALPVPEKTRSYLKTTYVQPETEMEKIVADTWKEVLGVDKVGINDNFFELGGNSLNIVQLASKLKKVLGSDIPTVTLFRFPKISFFLEYVNGMGEREEKEKIGVTRKERSKVVEKGKDMMRHSMQRKRRQQV